MAKPVPLALAEPGRRRRLVDPTTCEREYDRDDIEFMHAMDRYKRDFKRPYPTWSEVLEVLKALGYRKVAASDLPPA
jgi:FMN phosphatase YigB (HAD superfamily)